MSAKERDGVIKMGWRAGEAKSHHLALPKMETEPSGHQFRTPLGLTRYSKYTASSTFIVREVDPIHPTPVSVLRWPSELEGSLNHAWVLADRKGH